VIRFVNQVGDVEFFSFGRTNGRANAGDQEGGSERTIEVTGRDDDEVGVLNGVESSGIRPRGGSDRYIWARVLEMIAVDSVFAENLFTAIKGDKVDRIQSGRIDLAGDIKNVGGDIDCFRKVASHFFNGTKEDIAKGVAFETAVRKAIVEEVAEPGGLRESNKALADITWRQNT